MSEKTLKILVRLIKKANVVYICGNGGSSATAEHFANDLFSKGIKAICLNSNTSILTMIANDFGYEFVFSKQLELLAKRGDLLVVISASGNSKNIINALLVNKCRSIAMLGMGGGQAIELADDTFLVNSNDYGIVEDEHMRIIHEVKDLI